MEAFTFRPATPLSGLTQAPFDGRAVTGRELLIGRPDVRRGPGQFERMPFRPVKFVGDVLWSLPVSASVGLVPLALRSGRLEVRFLARGLGPARWELVGDLILGLRQICFEQSDGVLKRHDYRAPLCLHLERCVGGEASRRAECAAA
jgi:hypothetical protein